MSQQAKHTPGPWKVDPAEQRGISGSRIFKVISAAPYGGLIADISAWWVDTQSAERNARLIATAPDMLEALELASEHLREYWEVIANSPEDIDAAQIERLAKAIDANMAAIAKVKGE